MSESSRRLFDDFSRRDSQPSGYGEASFAHLNRRAGRPWTNVRDLLEDWFAHLPVDVRADVRGRFRRGDEVGFRSAFFEMYCHEILRRSSWAVTTHPALEGTSSRPDFAATRGGMTLIVEATTTNMSEEREAAQRRDDLLIDGINNRMEIGSFMLSLDIEARGSSTIGTAKLCTDLQRWLDSLDPENAIVVLERDPNAEPDTYAWERNGWRLIFTAWPLAAEHRGAGGRIVGTGLIDAGWIDDVKPLLNRFRAKTSAYGTLTSPFVVTVDAVSDFTGDNDIVSALYGSNAVLYYQSPGPNDPGPRQIRLPDGLWRGTKGWRATHVSAVMTTTTLKPWTVTRQAPTLWHHPHAERPIGDLAPLFRQARLYRPEGELHWGDPVMPAWQFFGLTEDWPGFDTL